MKKNALFAVLMLTFPLTIPVLGAPQSYRGVSSYGTIEYTSSFNVLMNPDFSHGFAHWSDATGWNVAPYGWASLDYSIFHNGAPSLRMEPDPYGVAAAAGIAGDCGSAWSDQIVVTGATIVEIGAWVKTDVNPSYPWNPTVPYGARLGCDFRAVPGPPTMWGTIINCTVPTPSGVPTVSWGTSGWTLIEYYTTVPAGANYLCIWPQTFPQHNGDTHACWYDDAYAVIVG